MKTIMGRRRIFLRSWPPVFCFLALNFIPFLQAQNAAPKLEITAIDPIATTIHLGQSVFLRVHYQSARALRLQASGQYQGRKTEDMSNASPLYPAGDGNALVWIAFRKPTRIDKIIVTASDSNWHPLQVLTNPRDLSWTAEAPDYPRAFWVDEMTTAQQEQVSTAMQDSTASSGFDFFTLVLFPLMYLAVLGYPLLQIFSLWRDGPLSLSALPMIVMIPVYLFTAYALARDSNLWPIYLIFSSPLAFLYLGVVRLFGRRA